VEITFMHTDLELMQFHVEALYTHDDDERLYRTNEPGGGPAPRFFLGRTLEGNVCRFRFDLPDTEIGKLESLAGEEASLGELTPEPKRLEAYKEVLGKLAPIQRAWMGPSYQVPVTGKLPQEGTRVTNENTHLLRGGFDWLVESIDDEQPCVAIVRDGRAVTICRSGRITAAAHEAGIETLPEFRGRGYAVTAVLGWAAAVAESGSLPLYSTSWENLASQRVAAKAAAVQYGVTLHIT
jgi:RimJ/RimL family protein N-acetyltransferase